MVIFLSALLFLIPPHREETLPPLPSRIRVKNTNHQKQPFKYWLSFPYCRGGSFLLKTALTVFIDKGVFLMHLHHLFMPCLIAAALGLYPLFSSSATQSYAPEVPENPPHRLSSYPSQPQSQGLPPSSTEGAENSDEDYVDMAVFDQAHPASARSKKAQVSPPVADSYPPIPSYSLKIKMLHCGRPGDLEKSLRPAPGSGTPGGASFADKIENIFSPRPPRKPAPSLSTPSHPFSADNQ